LTPPLPHMLSDRKYFDTEESSSFFFSLQQKKNFTMGWRNQESKNNFFLQLTKETTMNANCDLIPHSNANKIAFWRWMWNNFNSPPPSFSTSSLNIIQEIMEICSWKTFFSSPPWNFPSWTLNHMQKKKVLHDCEEIINAFLFSEEKNGNEKGEKREKRY
jgi:hypothetical protein